jgi:predicted nucleic acid-binding protein
VIVTDASAVLELVLRTRRYPELARRILDPEESLHAPHLVDLEVAQVLRRYWLTGELTARRAEEALADLRDLQLERHPHEPLLARVWELRHNLTAYDAVYVALAEGLSAPLLTCDVRLGSAPAVRAQVEVVRGPGAID